MAEMPSRARAGSMPPPQGLMRRWPVLLIAALVLAGQYVRDREPKQLETFCHRAL